MGRVVAVVLAWALAACKGDAPVPAAVAALSTEPLEPIAVQTQEEEKDYKGEYYPVARNVTPRN